MYVYYYVMYVYSMYELCNDLLTKYVHCTHIHIIYVTHVCMMCIMCMGGNVCM